MFRVSDFGFDVFDYSLSSFSYGSVFDLSCLQMLNPI